MGEYNSLEPRKEQDMAKKAELLEQAKQLNIEVSDKNTIAEIEALINEHSKNTPAKKETIAKTEQVVAKAGKHSAKGKKESEEKQAKIDKQQHKSDSSVDSSATTKKLIKPTRSKLERRGKKYKEAQKLVDISKEYSLIDAIDLAIKTSHVKFDASVELHIKLGVDPRQADQNIRGTVSLPAGTGKNVRVAVFADVDDAKKALSAGADIAGSDEFLQLLDKEQLEFDVLISTPQMMAKLGKYARLLGPKGLMPNPKSGTVTKDVVTAVKEAKTGKVEYRVDSTGIVHLSVGKVSFKATDLKLNISEIFNAVKSAKPSSLKGSYVQSIYLATSMGPSIKVSVSEI